MTPGTFSQTASAHKRNSAKRTASPFFDLFVVTLTAGAVLFAGCAPQAAPATSSAPTALAPNPGSQSTLPVASDTPVPVPPTRAADTSTPMPAGTAPAVSPPASPELGSRFDGLSTGLDNAKQARLRTISEVMGAPNMDVYVNGLPAFDGGVAQANIGVGLFSGWLYAAPGVYTIALVPHGGTIDQAFFAPAQVNAEAGHRYTVAAMGQLASNDVHPLTVDETALVANLGAGTTDAIQIDINNLTGADSITELANGKAMAEHIPYGEARAMFLASGSALFKTVADTTPPGTIGADTSPSPVEPGVSYAFPIFGPYPVTNPDVIGNGSQATSELNVFDFLAGFEGRGVALGDHPATFKTLLAAIDKAGWHDQLINSGPYFLLAPTDAAFDALPQADRDALLNDPQAAQNLLKAHLVDGYYPYGSLSGVVYGNADRTLQNRLGRSLIFEGDNLNGDPIGPNYTVGSGNRVQIVFNVLPYK